MITFKRIQRAAIYFVLLFVFFSCSPYKRLTSISQEIPLDTLFDALSKHLGMQVDMVHKHNGYIDKFGGDGLMAIFDGEEMAKNACNCALDIIDSSSRFTKITTSLAK